MPPFDLSDSGGIGLVALRGLVDIAVLTVFGTASLRLLVLPAALAPLAVTESVFLSRRLRRGLQCLAVATIVILFLWLIGVAQSLSGATDWPSLADAIGTVLARTAFGTTVLGEVTALAILAIVLLQTGIFAELLATLAAMALIALEATHGHAFSMGNTGLYVSTVLHLMAAGAWLGSLPALFWLARRLPPAALAALLRAFSPLGQICVLLIGVTAMLQSFVMIQTLHSLFTTAYGWTALLKLLLFGALLLLAAVNRWVWTPRLARGGQDSARRGFLLTLGIEIGAGVAVLLAAGLLASLPPVMAM